MCKEYILLNGSRLFYEEYMGSLSDDNDPPVFCWPSSFILSKYIERNPELIRNKCVLELGAGIGLPGLVCATLGAHKVYFADKRGNTKAQQLFERNIERNGLQSIGQWYPVSWGDYYPIEMEYPMDSLDVIIGADLCYDPKQLEPLVMTTSSILRYYPWEVPFYMVYQERSCKRNIGWLLDAWQLKILQIPLSSLENLETFHLYIISYY